MRKIALLAQWAGDFDGAQIEYDRLLGESLDKGDASEVRLLHSSQVMCGVVAALERGETDALGVINRITRQEEARVRDTRARKDHQDPRSDKETRTEEMMQAALQAGAKITKQALKRFRVDEAAGQEPRARPVRETADKRFISVFIHPRGLEARSYCRADISVDFQATVERMAKRNHHPRIVTDRMVEVEFQGETMELFLDSRIRCISESTNAARLASLVAAMAEDVVLAQRR